MQVFPRGEVARAEQMLRVPSLGGVACTGQCVVPLTFLPCSHVVAPWVQSSPLDRMSQDGIFWVKLPAREIVLRIGGDTASAAPVRVRVDDDRGSVEEKQVARLPTVDRVRVLLPMDQVHRRDVGPGFVYVTVGATRWTGFCP